MGTIALEATPETRAEANRRLADRLFRGALAVTAAITAVWLFFLLTGRDGGAAFAGRVDLEAVARVAVGFAIMTVLWGWLWYGVKRLLLRRLVGLSREETDARLSLAAEPGRSTCRGCSRAAPSAGCGSPT